MMSDTPFGRAAFTRAIQPGEFALALENPDGPCLLFGLDREKSGGASLVAFCRVQAEENGDKYLLAKFGTPNDLYVGRAAWVLPKSARIAVDFTSIRRPSNLHVRREAALALNEEGKLFCSVQSELWLDLADINLIDELPGKELSLLEYGSWSVVSGSEDNPVTHISFEIKADSIVPFMLQKTF